MTHTATRALLLRTLELQGPMTTYELAEELRVTYAAVHKHVAALHAADQVYVHSWLTRPGTPERAWAVGYMKDAPRPRRKTDVERNKAYRTRKRQQRVLTGWIQPAVM